MYKNVCAIKCVSIKGHLGRVGFRAQSLKDEFPVKNFFRLAVTFRTWQTRTVTEHLADSICTLVSNIK